MASQGYRLLQGGILPNDDFVVGIAVGAHYLFGVFGEHQIADLRACIDAVYHSIIKGIPKFDGFVG